MNVDTLASLTVAELRATAQARGIDGAARLRKAELIAALIEVDAADDSGDSGDGLDGFEPVEPVDDPAATGYYEHAFVVVESSDEQPHRYTGAMRTFAMQRGLRPVGPVELAAVEAAEHTGYKRLRFRIPVTA